MAHPIQAGQDMSSPEAASNSAHLCSHPHLHTMHAHEETEQQALQGHGQHHPFGSAGEHTHVHTWDRDAPALLDLPGRAHALKHLCKYVGRHAHTQLCETISVCKSKPGHSAVPLLCPALSMQILLVHNCATEMPSSDPKAPKAVPLAVQSLVWGTALPSTDSNMPLCLIPCQPGAALGTSTVSDV